MAEAILVLGATGRVGRQLVPILLRRNEAVRALVRDAHVARTILGPDVILIEGDLRDESARVAAAADCKAVVSLAAALGGPPDRGTPREIDCGAVAAMARLAAAQGVARFVLLSSAAVTQPEHPHNCTCNSMLSWKLRGEDAVRASGVPYSIVRALGLRDRPGDLQGIRIVQGDRIAFGEDIARADAAKFLADVVAPVSHDRMAGMPDLASTTCEIFNDAGVPGGTVQSHRDMLVPDPLPATMGARP